MSTLQAEKRPTFSDHKVVTIEVSYKSKHESAPVESQFLCDTGKKYKNLNFLLSPWDKIQEELETIDWAEFQIVASTASML